MSSSGHRTEVILSDATRSETGQFPSDPYGGAVAGSAKYTVIVGATAVTSYDNTTGHIRWQRPTGSLTQRWQSDGRYLYVSESATGYLGSSPVTALRRIDTVTGVEQQVVATEPLGSPTLYGTSPFAGTLTAAFGGVVLFSSASGVTAYSGNTGAVLWSMPSVVPEGVDPQQGRFYLARGSDLVAVSPQNGRIRAVIPAAGLYSVRDGVALGLDQGANGDAWGYYVAGQRITMTAPGLGWPHYFADLSGIGGSADPASDVEVIAACGQAGPAVTPSPPATVSPSATSASASTASPGSSASASSSASPTPTPTPTPSTSPAIQPCQKPELVALSL